MSLLVIPCADFFVVGLAYARARSVLASRLIARL